MKIKAPHERLASVWGRIDRQHNEIIARHLLGRRVLDVGCGYGSLVNYLQERGFEAIGVDLDVKSISVGKALFPRANIRIARAEALEHEETSRFDTVILKDCLHHLIGEGDILAAFRSFDRILASPGRIVVLDPNPNSLLRLARRIIRHQDYEVPFQKAIAVLERHGFRASKIEYYEVIGLPLSGGYVGPQLVPDVPVLVGCVTTGNRILSGLLNATPLRQWFCWRYIIRADRV
jgi:SAM-dependent methyltransferase